MLNFTTTNTTSNVATLNHNALSAASELLAGLGFADQRAEIVAADQAQHNNYLKLKLVLEKYQIRPDAKNQIKLIKALNKEIKRLKAEYKHIKAKQAEYQQAKENEQKPSSSYVAQWRNWLLKPVKQFFGSDNEYQAERYIAIAEARNEQIERLKKYRDEVKQKNKDKKIKLKADHEENMELSAGDASPMRRRLMTLPVTNEFRVNTYTTSDQQYSVVGVQPNGNFVIVWQSNGQDGYGYGVFAQQFNAVGLPLNSEFRVNTYTTGSQIYPAIGMQSNGNFIITWTSTIQDSGNSGIYAQRFNATGARLDLEFRINTFTAGTQEDSAIAVQPSGDFVIIWESGGQDGDSSGIYAQRFNQSGFPFGMEFQINTYTINAQYGPTIGIQSTGNFIIAWTSLEQDGSDTGVYAQQFNSSGVKLGLEFQVNTYTTSSQDDPAIGVQLNGNFVIAWRSLGQDGNGYEIYAKRFNAIGLLLSSEFRVNTYTTSAQTFHAIGMQSDGDFVITWASFGQDGNGYGIYAQQFNASGSLLGSEFRVNTYTTNAQLYPAIAVQLNSDFIITWSSNQQDGDSDGVYARIFRPLSMGNNTLTINQNQTIPLTATILSATSGGTPSDILFTVTNVVNGRFELSGNPGVAITQFNKQQIIDGVVRFVHNGSANAPGFSVTVTDGNETLGPYAATVNFTPTPVVSSSAGLSSSSTAGAGQTASSSTGGSAQSSAGNSRSTVDSSSTAANTNTASSSTAAGSSTGLFSSSAAESSTGGSQQSTGSTVAQSSSSSSSAVASGGSSSTAAASTGNAQQSSSGASGTATASSSGDAKDSSSSTASAQPESNSKLSTAAIAGIAAGAGVAVIGLCTVGFFCCRKKPGKNENGVEIPSYGDGHIPRP